MTKPDFNQETILVTQQDAWYTLTLYIHLITLFWGGWYRTVGIHLFFFNQIQVILKEKFTKNILWVWLYAHILQHNLDSFLFWFGLNITINKCITENELTHSNFQNLTSDLTFMVMRKIDALLKRYSYRCRQGPKSECSGKRKIYI